jgi:hypothetical protein
MISSGEWPQTYALDRAATVGPEFKIHFSSSFSFFFEKILSLLVLLMLNLHTYTAKIAVALSRSTQF